MALTQLAHKLISEHFQQPGTRKELAIDGTCGNGYDTEFLCRLGFDKVVAFDIQARAIEITRHRLAENKFENFELRCASHTEIERVHVAEIDCAMFNFGWLPHGDKEITTLGESSVQAVQQCCDRLSAFGLISLMCYLGHSQGEEETIQIDGYLASLSSQWRVVRHASGSENPAAPRLTILTREPESPATN